MSGLGLAGLEASGSTALLAVAWAAREGAGWMRARRKERADTVKTEAEIFKMLREQLVDEMNRRDAACEVKMRDLETRLRADLGHTERNLRQIIYALARGLKLDAKQRAVLDEIAPRDDAAEADMLATLGKVDAKRGAVARGGSRPRDGSDGDE